MEIRRGHVNMCSRDLLSMHTISTAGHDKDSVRWAGESDKAYPDIFTKPPTFPKSRKPGHLTREQFDQFFREVRILSSILYHGLGQSLHTRWSIF